MKMTTELQTSELGIIYIYEIQKQQPEAFCKKRFSKIFRKFHRKTPVLESLFNKVAGLQGCNFIRKRLQHRGFPVKFAKFFRTPTLKNICERLLLEVTVCKAALAIDCVVGFFIFARTIMKISYQNKF